MGHIVLYELLSLIWVDDDGEWEEADNLEERRTPKKTVRMQFSSATYKD
jgi:hypothetical protein